MTAIGAPNRCSQSKAALSEIQAVANLSPHAVVFNPLDVRLVHSSLINQVLDQPADRIVSERGDNGSIQSEATLESTSNVVFATSLPNPKLARVSNPRVPGVKAEHYLSEHHQIPTAFRFVTQIKAGH